MMLPLRQSGLAFVALILLVVGASSNLYFCSAFSMTMNINLNKGSAAKPFEKKKIAIFGAGGYLGGMIFGFLQRASSIYGTGIASINSSPRCVVASGVSSKELNLLLGTKFVLAQADESFVKLTDMTNIESIQQRISGYDAIVIGTKYTLEPRPVTPGSYDKTPNDKTTEFYLDRPRSSTVLGYDDVAKSEQMFQDIVTAACGSGSVKHMVIFETDISLDGISADIATVQKYLSVLDKSGIPYTYIRPLNQLDNLVDYTYIKGLQQDMNVKSISTNDIDGLQQALSATASSSSSSKMYREDLAAICVQSLLSLDWKESRILCVASNGVTIPPPPQDKKSRPKTDKEWCVNSKIVAEKLTSL